ncbi:YfdQ family protein [Pimelobacter simplex]|uniref:YfdQ family protein n=1 Tax=Nocardioides simplex TaxID=2045 RepID=UPI00214F8AE5|nr:YfdQ family protein [Pimelobacter simplex]UUW88360.1 YfdQ family protein [Pimelobacter simplex]UUW97864.1 YfdQ family protein [Pimelobacter simplex]
MTNYSTPDHATDTEAAVRAGIAIAPPAPLGDSDRFFVQTVPAGATTHVHDLRALAEPLTEFPYRKKGTVHVHDARSFVEYVEKHQLSGTEVWADLSRRSLVAVINAGEQSDDAADEGVAGHGDHRVVLELLHSDEWNTWTDRDKEWLDQATFAEHLEDHAINVVHPDAATMLEIAASLQATRTADIKAGIRLDNGQVQLRYEETETATAGQTGELEIPTIFVVALAPYVGAEPVEVEARFRYRLRQGNLLLSYALLNPADIARSVFTAIVDDVRGAVTAPVLLGRPA